MKSFNISKITYILVLCLFISLMGISIGFSAMSTTLTVNGNVAFKPVDMVRVTNYSSDTLYHATEIKSSYTPYDVSTYISIDENDGYATYNVSITNLGEVNKVLTKLIPEIYSNNDILYSLEDFKVGDVISAHSTKEFKIIFKVKDGVTLTENRLNVKFKFELEDYVYTSVENYDFYSEGECIFGGQNVAVQGECAKGTNDDIINTGIKAFSEENYLKSFIMTFTLTDMDDARLLPGKRDTYMNLLKEANNNEVGRYPGILFRIENSMLYLHVSNGQPTGSYATDIKFTKEDILNKELKIIRYNDGDTVKIYYMLDGEGPYFVMDITNLYSPFDTPLTFGSNLLADNVSRERYAPGTLNDITFRFAEKEEIIKLFSKPIDPGMADIEFSVVGTCTFNGAKENITGCEGYTDTNYINTGIYLFNEENYKRDFELGFTLSNYNSSNQEIIQATIFNAFLERTGRGYGILLRKNNNVLNLIVRDGNGTEKSININVTKPLTFKIVKKNGNVCYSVNNQEYKYILNMAGFTAPFNVPLTFGSSIDSSGNPWRYIKGDLTDMYVKVGTIDKDIVCSN